MKCKQLGIFAVCAALTVSVLMSCAVPMAELPVVGDSDASRAVIVPLAIQSITPATASTAIAISDSIVVTYNNKINATSLTASSVTVVNTLTGAAIAGRISLDATGLIMTFKPIFQTSAVSGSIITSGLKPKTKYTVVVSNSVKDINGSAVAANLTTTFTTKDLDYGIYWFNATGESEKFVPGKTNSFYDPSKPVIIFVHGWEKDSTANTYWREVPYLYNDKFVSNMNTGTFWKNAGYNIGVFYWNQFSDEGEVKDAEAKVWLGNNTAKKMRYRLSDNTYITTFSTTKSVTDLFYDEYVGALKGNTSGNIRLAGHSLGNQLATTLAWKVSNAVKAGTISSAYLPNRLALLDPFWGKNAAAWAGNKWTGEVCRTYVNDLITRHGIVVEQIKSSALGGTIGDDNLEMRKKTCFFRVYPDFISTSATTDAAYQHGYSVLWYFWSMSSSITVPNGALGAAVPNATVKSMMNYGKTAVYYWSNTGACKKTATPLDDTFIRTSGVKPN